MELTYFSDSFIGDREQNEDCQLFYPLPFQQPIAVFAVADGMGGLSAGADCARRTAAAFCGELLCILYPEALHQPDKIFYAEELERGAHQAIRQTAERIYRENCGRFYTTGSTLTVAILSEDALTIAALGDSPAYLAREGKAALLAPLHNLAFIQGIAPDAPGYEQAACCLTQCVGTRPAESLKPVVCTYPLSAMRGGRLLLGSDGAFGGLTAERIAQIVQAQPKPQDIIPAMFAQARASGATDNQTLTVVCL